MESGNYDINRQYFCGKKVFVELSCFIVRIVYRNNIISQIGDRYG